MPEKYKDADVTLFKLDKENQEHYVKIQCKNKAAVCRDQSYHVDISYISIV
jgi:hypothetical protein